MRSIERRRLRKRRARSAAFLRGLIVVGVATGPAACSNVEPVAPTTPPITTPTALYTRLTLDYPAVTLSVDPAHNTVQLTATPRDALGNPMSGPAPIYRSSDTTKVTVADGGVVTARAVTTGVTVSASVTVGALTHTDTARIQVTNLTDPPALASLSIHPVLPDSAIWSVRRSDALENNVSPLFFHFAGYWRPGNIFGPQLVPHAVSTAGDTLTDLVIDYVSLDPAVATVDRKTGVVATLSIGQVRMVAQTMAYGIVKADTVTFTVTFQAVDEIKIVPLSAGLGFVANEIVIRPYGIVFWRNSQTDTIDVTFDDPTNVAAAPSELCGVFYWSLADPSSTCGTVGNALLPGTDPQIYGVGTLTARQFPVPGVYSYRSTRTGATGRIVVTNNLADW